MAKIKPIITARKQAKQTRSLAMIALILQAATRILSRESLTGFNTNRIAEVAGISVGSLYQYFPNKSAIMAALIEAEQNNLAQALSLSVTNHHKKTLTARLTALIDIAITHQFGNVLFAAAIDHEERRLPVQHLLQPAQTQMCEAVIQILQCHSDEITVRANIETGIDCLTICKAIIESNQSINQSSFEIRSRALRAVLGYLTHTPSS
jgi:AcrR family transcriptional regulator